MLPRTTSTAARIRGVPPTPNAATIEALIPANAASMSALI